MATESDRQIEYTHKKATYVFPSGTQIFAVGDSMLAEIKGRKTRDFSPYIVPKTEVKSGYPYRIGLPITGVGSALIKEYEVIAEYFRKHKRVSFLQFDHATSREVALCTFFKPMDFVKAGNLTAEITRSLPFLVNIFRRPLIHLRQTEIIQPVDAVKRVNHNTIRHLTRHSEHWKDIDYVRDEIVPAKLLTRVYEDDYSIYENVIFRDLIDRILLFLRKRIYYLTEILETFKESIQLDAVNRFNHQKYYLAIGKLYVGFYKMENSSEIQTALENLKQLYKQINRYKNRAVYTRNVKVKPTGGDVKRTNILTMHKDYRHVLSLYQKFQKNSAESKEPGTFDAQVQSQRSYEQFCAMLMVFAANNFNMECLPDDMIFSNGNLDAYFEYQDWNMTLKSELNPILGLNIIEMNVIHTTTVKTFVIIPMGYYIHSDKKRVYESIIERLFRSGEVCDKYIFLEPFDAGDNPLYNYSIQHVFGENRLFYSVLPVSITEINSFRRIQKLIFEGMVLSNAADDVCAFCGEALTRESDVACVCRKCKMCVKKITCKHCGSEFKATYAAIKNSTDKNKKLDEESLKAIPEFYRQEKEYLFRNIVNMAKGGFVCPHCGEV